MRYASALKHRCGGDRPKNWGIQFRSTPRLQGPNPIHLSVGTAPKSTPSVNSPLGTRTHACVRARARAHAPIHIHTRTRARGGFSAPFGRGMAIRPHLRRHEPQCLSAVVASLRPGAFGCKRQFGRVREKLPIRPFLLSHCIAFRSHKPMKS